MPYRFDIRGSGARSTPRALPPGPRSSLPVAILPALAIAGCAGAPAQRARPSESHAPALELTAPAFTSPARWSYHPGAPDLSLAELRLGDGSCVVLAEGGQRWTVAPARRGGGASPGAQAAPDADAGPACAGQGVASHVFAPEPLVDLARRSPSSWLFFGASGAVYESATPLGAFVRTIAPPEPLLRLAGAGDVLLAVTRDGALLRHDGQGSWTPISVARGPAAAPAVPPRVFDIAVAEGGRALALALPEALFATEDGGASWIRAPVPAMGLSRVHVTGGELRAEGALTSVTWDPRRTPPFSRIPAGPPISQEEIAVDVGRAPTSAAVQYGRAVVSGDRYYEVIRPEEPGAPWLLASGTIEGPLDEHPIQGSSECGSIKLGASGRGLVAVCVRSVGDAIVAAARRSDDGGSKWSAAARLETPDTDRVGVAVSPDGAALITGVCKPPEKGGPDQGGECRPSAPVLLRPEGDRVVAALVTAPTLGALAALPGFSADGRSAYFAGYRAKDDRLAVFVSHDGGETFSPRPIERASAGSAAAASADEPEDLEDVEGSEDREGREGGFELTEDSALRVGEDGTVGLLVSDGGAMRYVTADEDGRILAIASPPAEGAIMGGFGRRVVALAPAASAGAGQGAAMGSPGGGDGIDLWESLDGGVSWSELPPTPALSRDFFRGAAGIACGAAGCLLGDTVTRVGWGGQIEAQAAAPEPPAPQAEPSARTPIVCDLAASKWTRIDHVAGNGWGLPGGNEAMRGRSVWSVLTHDPSGAVSVVAALLPESGAGASRSDTRGSGSRSTWRALRPEPRIITRPLFPAEPRGARVSTYIATQMEGYAAARVRIPGAPGSDAHIGAPMRDVSVAWENWMDGTSARGSIPDAGSFGRTDIRTAAGDIYDPDLVSVSLRGVFVRPHAAGDGASALTFFFEPGGRLQRFDYPVWPGLPGGPRADIASDAVLTDGQPVAVGMIRQGGGPITTLLLAHRPPGAKPAEPWTFEAVTVAPSGSHQRDLVIQTDWTYAGRMIGVTSLISDPRRSRAWAMFQPFRGDGTLGPAQPLPTPYDLPDPPRPCTPAERASTARLEALMFLRGEPFFPGTRHPVLVAAAPGLQDSLLLLTSSAVLHGTPSAPCVAAWEANATGRLPVAAVLSGDLSHSWLFRRVEPQPPQPSGSATVAIEARPMTCRLDPSAKVPEAIWSEPATSRFVP
ncbi:MAG: hypothetical protein IT372_26315 [Polyangiaceae bacterium]|nr:hypothetical protein [Polyangiaceae bacterium]